MDIVRRVAAAVGAALVVAGVATAGSAAAATPKDAPVSLGGYHLATFAHGTSAYFNPDPIVADGGFVYVAYQNDTKADGSDGKSSTIVQYAMDGKALTTFSVTGHCDGLRVDPTSYLLWATVNEDSNAVLYTVDPKSGTVSPYKFSSAAHGGGYDDLAFAGGSAFVAASNPSTDAAGVSTGPAVVKVSLQGARRPSRRCSWETHRHLTQLHKSK